MLKKEILDTIKKTYPMPKCELKYNTPFELLVSVILSAQCTDKRVVAVTEKLFLTHNTPLDFVNISQLELEEKIHSCGFFRTKAKNIKLASQDILNKYNSIVPNTMKDLVSLAGVGTKTASVVQGEAFGIPALAVDTHVFRVSNRLGLVNEVSPEKTRLALLKIVPKNFWIQFHQSLVLHGRYVCKSQKPNCEQCTFSKFCNTFANKGQ